jgi:hypothetical protein
MLVVVFLVLAPKIAPDLHNPYIFLGLEVVTVIFFFAGYALSPPPLA